MGTRANPGGIANPEIKRDIGYVSTDKQTRRYTHKHTHVHIQTHTHRLANTQNIHGQTNTQTNT